MNLLPLAALLVAQSPRAISAPTAGDPGPRVLDLAGRPLGRFPHFHRVRTFNEGDPIHVAIDTSEVPDLVRRTVDVWLLGHERLPEALGGSPLGSVSGRPTAVTVSGNGLTDNVFQVDPGTLRGNQDSLVLGRGYDVVVDVDRDGFLGPADLLDGSPDVAGFFVVRDFVTFRGPETKETGPYQVERVLFNGGTTYTREVVYFPTNIAELDQLPLMVVSHGNGHDYRWYDHIGYHMASWGYVVMSHANNTGPGIQTASTSTLQNTEVILSRTDEIAGGALVGHLDVQRIVWIGHSRGGEGVVRAYRRLLQGTDIAQSYGPENIRLVSSIAPTDFLGPVQSNVGSVPYHLWTGGADSDVNGCANCDICQTFHLLGRAAGPRYGISLHGAGHGDFHDGGGNNFSQGPCKIFRVRTHPIMRGYLLPLVQYVVDGNPACQDYLTRQYEEFRPLGTPGFDEPCVHADLVFQDRAHEGDFVLDDFQSHPELDRSSSGGRVLASVGLRSTLFEGALNDANNGFTFTEADPMNGMTWAGPGDDSAGLVLEWNATNEFLAFELPAGHRDLSAFRTLSFRAAQSTRSPETIAALGDLDFEVELWDRRASFSAIRISSYGGGVEEPYQRTGGGCGAGAGWANEFETLRIPLADFARDGRLLDLTRVVSVIFRFGPGHGHSVGRIGLDDIELTID
jgi:hypothetical protein